ncbi:MAG: hypothetical protein A2901_06680 [Elusimicrobia bacterium RIFCSPLOWO2_01_FULL_54_10]|nr:MAG: hypothetical protein A2901_06680 [Elusimicrobia bacterium RIFCSPLOWO2_01_FULL_54_10]
MIKPPVTFSDFIQGGLNRSSLSLRELCRKAGTDPSFMSKVLRGKLPPPSDEKLLNRLAKALGLDALTLIITTGWTPSQLRQDPETLKSLLEGRSQARKSPAAPQRRERAFQVLKSPQLSEDLL